MEHCENIVKELLSVRSFPQRARIFTQLKPVCVKNDKGKVIFKMEMYANKNNDSRDAIRVDMVKGFIQNGQKMMCGQEDLKIIMNLIDIRIALRLEEDLNEVGHFDISEKICLTNKQ
jgi:hypothetical protein